MPDSSLTVPSIARTLAVSDEKVTGWIRAGELRAINIAQKRGGRPRWRILDADFQAFLSGRAAIPETPAPPKRHRQRAEAGVIEFF